MPAPTKTQSYRDLIHLVRRLFHRFGHAAAEIHATSLPAIGMRAMLEDVWQNGPRTVPELAASRPVSRQHVLRLVTMLKDEGLVEYRDNPRHRRSFLVAATPAGERRIHEMYAREEEVFAVLCRDLSQAELRSTVATLRRVNAGLVSRRFGPIQNESDGSGSQRRGGGQGRI